MLAKSVYLEAVKQAQEQLAPVVQGDLILVEKIPVAEVKTSSGIIIATPEKQVRGVGADLPTFVRVLAVGPGYYDEDTNETVPLEARPGAVVMVGENSVKWFSQLPLTGYKPYEIGLTREAEIQLKFKDDTEYEGVFRAINRGLETKVGEKA